MSWHGTIVYRAVGFFLLREFRLGEPTDPGGGIGGTGITGFGVVQKFGSIFVNGREYFLDGNTRITRDGVSAGEKMLQLGDVVSVEGRIDTASGRSIAVHVNSELALQGAIEKMDAASGTLTVLGQTVYVTPNTLGDGPKNVLRLAQMHRGARVAVSGLIRSGGSWTATRIVPVAADETRFVLRGKVQNIDQVRGRLRVAGRELTAPAGKLPAQLGVGDVVRVDGRYAKAAFLLERIKSDRPMPGPTGRVMEMSGYVQTRPHAGELVSNDIVLRYSDASTFIGGTAADLRENVPVAIRGELQADGSVAVRAILVNVEPMRVTLPEPEVRAPRASGDEGRASNGVAEKPAREKPETAHTDAEKREVVRPDEPGMEKPNVEKPEIERPEIERPAIERPEIEKPNVE